MEREFHRVRLPTTKQRRVSVRAYGALRFSLPDYARRQCLKAATWRAPPRDPVLSHCGAIRSDALLYLLFTHARTVYLQPAPLRDGARFTAYRHR